MISQSSLFTALMTALLVVAMTDAFAPMMISRGGVINTVTTTTRYHHRSKTTATTTTTTTMNLFGFKDKTDTKEAEKDAQEQAPVAELEAAVQQQQQQQEEPKNDAKAQMANMMKPIKEAGPAGALSLFLWEGAFWLFSIPICSVLYYQATGSWPDWSQKEDVAKVTAEAFAFANIARFALPLRVGLAVATTPWVKENIVDRFGLFQSSKAEDENKANGEE
jgi:hypothetical protein